MFSFHDTISNEKERGKHEYNDKCYPDARNALHGVYPCPSMEIFNVAQLFRVPYKHTYRRACTPFPDTQHIRLCVYVCVCVCALHQSVYLRLLRVFECGRSNEVSAVLHPRSPCWEGKNDALFTNLWYITRNRCFAYSYLYDSL